ncbi:MAG TPA: MFS transporter [Actinomycetota bacterium]|nr:MFS transporter [Actinomycetota bacterium]
MRRDPPPTARVMTPGSVVRVYLAISGLFTLSASVIWGVNTLFLLDAGLDIFEVFIANAAFTAGMVLFEIPTGVVADTGGRRRSFLLSAVTLLIGTLGYVAIAATGGGLISFVAASLVLGLGFSFYSGAVEAWLVDALQATGFQGQLERIFARGEMVSGVAMLVGSVGGGVLGNLDLAWPFLARASLLAAVFVVGLVAMHDIGFTPRATNLSALPGEMNRVLQASVRFGWRARPVRLLMLVSLVQGVFTMWGFYAWQPYFLELLGRDAVWVAGVVSALTALSTIAGNALVEFFTRFCGRRTTMLITAMVVLAATAVGVGVAGSFWLALVLLLVLSAADGVAMPVQQAYLHDVIPSAQRATVVSSVSLMGSAGGIGGQLGLGYIARAQSIAAGYVAGGLTMLLALPPLLLLRRMGEPADRIAGRRAGTKAPCAGQGLPQVASVDTTVRQPVRSGEPG